MRLGTGSWQPGYRNRKEAERDTEQSQKNRSDRYTVSDSDSQFMSKSELTFIAENNCTCLDWIKERTLVVAELLQKLLSQI